MYSGVTSEQQGFEIQLFYSYEKKYNKPIFIFNVQYEDILLSYLYFHTPLAHGDTSRSLEISPHIVR